MWRDKAAAVKYINLILLYFSLYYYKRHAAAFGCHLHCIRIFKLISNDVFHENDVCRTFQNLPKKLKKSKPDVSLRNQGADVLS